MARNRVYRHDVRCPGCGSIPLRQAQGKRRRMRKDGHVAGRQAYRCGDCGRRSTPGGAYCRPGPGVKERALAMYAEGSSLRAIGRALGYSAPAVLGWVKREGGIALSRLRALGGERTAGRAGRQPAVAVSFDEMWTYRGPGVVRNGRVAGSGRE